MIRPNQSLATFNLFLILLSIMLMSRSFLGIKHDGIFYFLQSLKIKNPNIYNHDIFFLNGSQDQYTLFTNLYSYLINTTNASIASAGLELIGLLSWIASLFFLARSILPFLLSILTVGCAITLDNYYGSHQVFAYAEPYLTARLYAEIFSLVALGLFLRNKYIFGSIILLFSLAFHPLITLPVVLIGIGLVVSIRSWILFSLIAIMLGILLGELQVAPFNGLTETMSKEWYDYNIARSPFVFLHAWDAKGFSQLLYVVSSSYYIYKTCYSSNLKKLSAIIFLATISIFTIEFIGGSILKLPLVVALQLHRILWIDLTLIPFLLISLAWNIYNLSLKNESLIAILLLSLLLLDDKIHGFICFLIIIALLIIKNKNPEYIKKQTTTYILFISIFIPLFFSLLEITTNINTFQYISDKSNISILIANPVFTIIIITIIYFILTLKNKVIKLIAHSLTLALISISLLNWYNNDLMYFQEAAETYYDSKVRQEAIAPIRALIPEDTIVYWVESPRKSWFWLKRANYVSMEQGAGSVFNEANTLELVRRTQRVKAVSFIDSEVNWSVYEKYKSHRPKNKVIDQISLDYLCDDKILDFIIAEQKRFEVNINLKTFIDPIIKTKYGLYQCSKTKI